MKEELNSSGKFLNEHCARKFTSTVSDFNLFSKTPITYKYIIHKNDITGRIGEIYESGWSSLYSWNKRFRSFLKDHSKSLAGRNSSTVLSSK